MDFSPSNKNITINLALAKTYYEQYVKTNRTLELAQKSGLL